MNLTYDIPLSPTKMVCTCLIRTHMIAGYPGVQVPLDDTNLQLSCKPGSSSTVEPSPCLPPSTLAWKSHCLKHHIPPVQVCRHPTILLTPLLHTGSHIVTGFQSYELQSQPTSSHLNICNLNVPRLHRERTEQQEEVQLQHPSRNRRGHRPWLNTLLRIHWSTWCIYQITHSDYDYRSICKCHSAIGTRTRCNLGG